MNINLMNKLNNNTKLNNRKNTSPSKEDSPDVMSLIKQCLAIDARDNRNQKTSNAMNED